MNVRATIRLAVLALGIAPAAFAAPIRVCATTPDLGDLARHVGGDAVDVTVFAKGTEDPHFVEPRPSFVKALSRADLFVQTGLELELGWAPVLLRTAANPRVQPGTPGYFDASRVITPLEVLTTADRSMGDVHPLGNPHYLLDPGNGLAVAAALRDRLTELRPEAREALEASFRAFAKALGTKLVGPRLAEKYDPAKLALLQEKGELESFLEERGDADALAGWLGALRPFRGTQAVADHNLWRYFERAFGLEVVAFLEPKPGITPTTRHLGEVVEEVRRRRIPLLFAAAYYDRRHADVVARATEARVVELAHQVGAMPSAATYLDMIDTNVGAIASALRQRS